MRYALTSSISSLTEGLSDGFLAKRRLSCLLISFIIIGIILFGTEGQPSFHGCSCLIPVDRVARSNGMKFEKHTV
jgi:hypothetical protein